MSSTSWEDEGERGPRGVADADAAWPGRREPRREGGSLGPAPRLTTSEAEDFEDIDEERPAPQASARGHREEVESLGEFEELDRSASWRASSRLDLDEDEFIPTNPERATVEEEIDPELEQRSARRSRRPRSSS